MSAAHTERVVRLPLSGRGVWRGEELAASDDWLLRLSPAHHAELDGALREARARRLSLADLGPDTFAWPALRPLIARIEDELENGRGFAVVRGLSLDGLSAANAGLLYFAIGRVMGRPIRQNAQGHLLGHVQDTGRDILRDPNVRGYQTRIALPFHTDTSTDLLGLLCYRPAKSGGMSALAPLLTIYNELLASRPDLVETLYGPFHYDCREEEHPDGGPYYTRVAASVCEGRLSLRHNSGYARTAQRHPGCPRLTDEQRAVLDEIDRLAQRHDIHFQVRLEAGDMLFLDNYQVMHARTAFEDHPEPERKRHLMRLWLQLYRGRPLARDFDNRGGIVTTAGDRSDGLPA